MTERPEDAPRAIILGARSMVGDHLIRRLTERGYEGLCLSRAPRTVPPLPRGFSWARDEDLTPRDWQGAAVFSLAPLHRVSTRLAAFDGAAQVIAASSARISYEPLAGSTGTSAATAELKRSEDALRSEWESKDLSWTILRPTMIYDPWRDANVSRIARIAQRFGIVPVLAPADGRVQPIHADDVAEAMVAAVGNRAAQDTTLDLAGGETITFREMVVRIFEGLGSPPRVLPIPRWALQVGLAPLSVIGRKKGAMAAFHRMNQDRVVDGSPAARALAISPRPFRPVFPKL